MDEETDLVRCVIEEVYRSTEGPVVFLVPEEDHDRVLPIFIDYSQAYNIQTALRSLPQPRPMTHDLMNEVVQGLGGRFTRIVVEDLAQATFFATLTVEMDGNGRAKSLSFDARPSDCLALAARTNAPIYVRRSVLEDAAVERPELDEGPLEVEATDDDVDLGVEP